MENNRFEMVNLFRIISVLGIIWMHTAESFLTKTISLSKFAVPFFTCAAVFFVFNSVKNKPELTFLSYITSRFKRIYIPFLIWAFIYLLIRIINEIFISKTGFPKFNLYSFLLSGNTPHLWFLPFILIVTIISFLIAKFILKKPQYLRYITIITFIFLGCIISLYHLNLDLKNHYMLSLAFLTLPSFFWGISISTLYHTGAQNFFEKKTVIIMGLLSFIILGSYNFFIGSSNLIANAAGIAGLIGSINHLSNKFISYISKLGVLTMGVYLCHLLFIEGLQSIFRLFGYGFFWVLDLFVFFAATVASFIFVKIILSNKWTRWLVK